MSRSVQEFDLSPAAGPDDRPVIVGDHRAGNPPEIADEQEQEPADSLIVQATGTEAVGYYLSMLLHLIAYGIAAVVFGYFSQILNEDDVVTPIRASLDDTDRNAERPKFEITPVIDMGSAGGDSNIKRMSNNLLVTQNGVVEALNNDLLPSMLNNNDETDHDSGTGDFLFRLPESGLAVTKGSFTVWTEPESPNVREPYLIIIEVLLPEDTKAYRVNDLTGFVVGSDSYRQKIPFDPAAPDASFYTDENQKLRKISGSEQIKVRRHKVQLAIRVPGAQRLVKDTIQIRSRRLREKQDLELIFGAP